MPGRACGASLAETFLRASSAFRDATHQVRVARNLCTRQAATGIHRMVDFATDGSDTMFFVNSYDRRRPRPDAAA